MEQWALDTSSAQGLIRAQIDRSNLSDWGLQVYRCTTDAISQSTWDQYVILLRQHLTQPLSEKSDADLFQSMVWPMVEETFLPGATWQQARDHFDVWVKQELAEFVPTVDPIPWEMYIKSLGPEWDTGRAQRNAFQIKLSINPRHMYFVYVNDASVLSSNLESECLEDKGYVTVFRTGLHFRGEDYELEDLDADIPAEDDEELWDYWNEFRQKIRTHDLTKIYALNCRLEWPDGWIQDNERIAVIDWL